MAIAGFPMKPSEDPTMRWSEMTKQQRKLLVNMASTSDAAKLALKTAKALDRDACHAGRQALVQAMEVQFTSKERGALARKLAPGTAGGTGFLQRKAPTAMPMQF